MTQAEPRLAGALAAPPAGTRALVLAYSGGLDSTALLHALTRHAEGLPVRALHVCHHLHPQAGAWAAQCARQCAAWDVDFERIDVTVNAAGRGVEAAARAARYDALRRSLSPGDTLVSAHHADDQAETFLLQALRGAGPAGLAGMAVYSVIGDHGYWRPWLTIERGVIRDYAQAHRLSWIEDPSNSDPDLARSYLREHVMPQLRARWPSAAATLSRSAQHAAEANALLESIAAEDLVAVRDAQNALIIDRLRALPETRQRALVRHWLGCARRDTPDHRHLQQIFDAADSALTASPCVRFGTTEVRVFAGRLFCMPVLAASPRAWRMPWSGREPLVLPGDCGTLTLAPAPTADLGLTVALRRGGETLARAGSARRRLKDFLREQRIAPWLRQRLPLVFYRDTLVCVADRWRHPDIDSIVGAAVGDLCWQHRLTGGTLRVVGA